MVIWYHRFKRVTDIDIQYVNLSPQTLPKSILIVRHTTILIVDTWHVRTNKKDKSTNSTAIITRHTTIWFNIKPWFNIKTKTFVSILDDDSDLSIICNRLRRTHRFLWENFFRLRLVCFRGAEIDSIFTMVLLLTFERISLWKGATENFAYHVVYQWCNMVQYLSLTGSGPSLAFCFCPSTS